MKTKMLLAISLFFCNTTFANEMNFNFDKIEKDLLLKIEVSNQKLQEEITKKMEENFIAQIEKFNEDKFFMQANFEEIKNKKIELYNDINK